LSLQDLYKESHEQRFLPPRSRIPYTSEFKKLLSTIILQKKGVFAANTVNDEHFDYHFNMINKLLFKYAKVELSSLSTPSSDAFTVTVRLSESNNVIPIDNLSSGQKEIISTLFLYILPYIW
jgi:hypothetical protein